ncbi:transcription factor Tfb4 [Annulohypoxylon maeteangense]|uniref:transcription factor Tfb4 n=1 Tax=Annulohypoxylon maeteangense TaxID=1927788 RepID=UPI00200793D4|nr:transcription factor Tfb4 [Annulohypoxylon maeteangense]KAI0879974.1 transcription factor Tfb4 [Annulohypoxylon maeteangense]
MNRIDASDHYNETPSATNQIPSLLTIVIDTNPRAWAALSGRLTIANAVANLLVFVNAHLAYGNDNHVAILAAHPNRAVWLYPKSPNADNRRNGNSNSNTNGSDVEMTDVDGQPDKADLTASANKFPQFAQIETSLLTSLRTLIESTGPSDLNPTTLISGALTMALSYIHKMTASFEPAKTSSDPANPPSTTAVNSATSSATLHSRILVLSVSDSEPAQYIPTMNAVFAASHARIAVDTLSLHGTPTFLQQAAFITSGTFLSAASNPGGLLSYLMCGFLADAEARKSLVTPTQDTVDFRAACFCHRRVIDTGFVCSICLSIFCEVPEGAECLTCGTKLALGSYGAKPAVVPRRKKKKKTRINGVSGREETGSATGTPVPG